MHSTAAIREINAGITSRRKRTGTRFPGIDQDAYTLGTSRPHLWMVLTGQRHSPELINRYVRLLTQQSRPIPASLGRAA